MPPSHHRIIRAKDSVENRRARGEISCAECRRHKLKCDKAIPCSTCVRKGCQSICPNGTLAPTHGTRPNAPDAVVFDAKISELSNRIRQLEDALHISHSTVSSAQHPLLAEDLLQIKNRAVASTSSKVDNDTVDMELVDSLGTLAVTERGTETYIRGPSSDLLTKHILTSAPNFHSESSLTLPAPVSYLSKTFPFTPLYLPANEIQAYIQEKLPSYERASSLTEAFLENLSWFFRPVEREQIMGELIPIVYKKQRRHSSMNGSNGSHGGTPSSQSSTDPHVLSLLLAVFAAGAAADMTLPPWNDEAELYYHLARTALSLKPVFEGAGLHAVQAIALIGAYDLFACRKNELEGSWKIIAFSLSLAASIGLNRDPAHFDLSPTLIQRRRRVFWELHCIDIWKSLATGRPVTFTNSVIDCEFPDDTDADLCGPDNPDSIWRIRYRYIKDIMSEIVSKLNSTRAVKYSEILALDQKIREYDPQGIFSSVAREHIRDHTSYSLQGLMRLHQLSITKDITLLLLHRSFFARALIEDPANPVRTQFGPSFLSMYRSAASILSTMQKQIDESGHYLLRCWPVLGHALHASIVLGSIAACGTTSALAPQAFIHFENASGIFSAIQIHPLFEAALPILSRLREQAVQALAKHGNEIRPQLRSVGPSLSDSQDFHPLTSLGHTVKRSLDGEFGTTPLRFADFVQTDGKATSSENSSPTQLSVFSGTNGSYPDSPLPIMPEYDPLKVGDRNKQGLRRSLEQRTDSDGDSEMGHPNHVPRVAGRSLSLPRDPPTSFSLGRGEGSVFRDRSDMLVDQRVYTPSNGNSNRSTFDTRLFNLRGSSPSPDILSTYMTFANMPKNDSNMPGSSFVADTTPMHSTSDPFAPPNDSSAFSSLSALSPDPLFNSDFDVSFDMRSSAGQESFLPLLPGDTEAWRTIIQDSRFFGLPGEPDESERNTPK